MHGAPVQPHFFRDDLRHRLTPEPVRLELVCLMWEVRKRGLEVGLSIELGSAPEQVWRVAANYDVDLIVLSEPLFGSFCPLASRSGAVEAIQGAPCPLLVVENRTKGSV
jgi:hypothetical protein